MDTVIQRLQKNDLVKMRKLNNLFADVFNDTESYQHHQPKDEYLTRFLEDEDHIVLVAEARGEVIGGLVAYCLTKFESERTEIYVYDLAVARKLQRQGIGRKLMQELKGLAKTMDACTIFVQADEGDDAIKFYESLGPSENVKTRNFDFNLNLRGYG